jgi:hypothetical protein
MYKDKDKQREANRAIQAKRRAKGVTPGVTESGCDTKGVTEGFKKLALAANGRWDGVDAVEYVKELRSDTKLKRGKDIKEVAKHNCGAAPIDKIPYAELRGNEIVTLKRGKDIKCFADLPPDVQETIVRMTTDRNGKMDQIARAKRTAAAIKYQHLFPHKYDNPGPVTDAELVVVMGKPGDEDYDSV